jgi:purine-binding chemotaxis protein CheW
MDERRQLCCFQIEELLFGIPLERVQEVLRAQPLTPVPLAPPEVGGLVNLRGQIVTALDLRRCLELPARPAALAPGNVVVRDGESVVSLLVDRIGDVIEVESSAFERPPETLRGRRRTLIEGAFKLRDRLLLVLDVDRLLELGGA